ncbi:hypothetical protein SAMN02983003_0825 [Devosia enhydra]|uniref:DnaA protein n=1 Tax=Devosia enhydra TaxID=665118 RepID=A0A1K2HU85_9HYPH|nr:hypothetical protein [Devosia enhydra]SFZ82000.1 hypothetical protein SAMN02983003_0825 [Devosia enhydra]
MKSAPRQLPFAYEMEASHAEDDFIVGEGNLLAHGHLLAWPRWPGPLTLIEGPASTGKSHLARIWAERSGARIVTPLRIAAMAAEGGGSPIVIEDIDREGFDERALFHLLNQSMRDGRSVLMTARTPVAAWPYATDDVRSRARLAARFALAVTDDIALSQMLVKLFSDRQVKVEPRVIAYLAARMERSAEAAVRLVETIDRLALARGVAISRAVAAEALAIHEGTTDAWLVNGSGDAGDE